VLNLDVPLPDSASREVIVGSPVSDFEDVFHPLPRHWQVVLISPIFTFAPFA